MLCSASPGGAGMAVLAGTYGAVDGAADECTPPGLGSWLMGRCWGVRACFGVFSRRVGRPVALATSLPSRLLAALNTTSTGHRCAMLLWRLRSGDERKRQFPPYPDRFAEMQSLADSGA